MTPRPFYHWKSFWLGLFVLVFFGWAWWDSMQFRTDFSFERGAGRIALFQRKNGSTGFVLNFPYKSKAGPKFGFSRHPAGVGTTGIESLCKGLGLRCYRLRDTTVFIPFVVLWLAWLVWNWKREQRKLNS